MTLAQAAELSACSTKTLRRAIDAGSLAACRLGQGAKSDRIHPEDLAVWWAKCRLQACQSPSVPTEAIKLQLDTAEERIARRLAAGRTRTPKPSPIRKIKSPRVPSRLLSR
ncbi:helix-turn-helix domain-containing protein [Stenotrophomonas rhizophila]